MKLRRPFLITIILIILATILPGTVCADIATPFLTEEETFDHNDLFITEDVAYQIATMFIDDMVQTGTTVWTDETAIQNCTKLYKNTTENIVIAYSFELTHGYVIISSYLDVPNIILEWSDVADPLYSVFKLSESDKILYTGPYGFYLDNGASTIEYINGEKYVPHQISCRMESLYSIDNISPATLEFLSNDRSYSSAQVPAQLGATVNSSDGSGNSTTNPYTHADKYYDGPFLYSDQINKWDASGNLSFEVCVNYEEDNNCGPTAITNMLIMYGKRFGTSSIPIGNDVSVYNRVVTIGKNGLYYTPLTGTSNARAYSYIHDCFAYYGVTLSSLGKKTPTYASIKSAFSNDHLCYLMVSYHPQYDNHHMVGYAYIRLKNASGTYVTYLKVADGWYSAPRYIDISTLMSDAFWEVDY